MIILKRTHRTSARWIGHKLIIVSSDAIWSKLLLNGVFKRKFTVFQMHVRLGQHIQFRFTLAPSAILWQRIDKIRLLWLFYTSCQTILLFIFRVLCLYSLLKGLGDGNSPKISSHLLKRSISAVKDRALNFNLYRLLIKITSFGLLSLHSFLSSWLGQLDLWLMFWFNCIRLLLGFWLFMQINDLYSITKFLNYWLFSRKYVILIGSWPLEFKFNLIHHILLRLHQRWFLLMRWLVVCYALMQFLQRSLPL